MNRNMEAITWALHARGISPTAFRLLIQLCSHVNSTRDDFEVWPAHATVAEECEISVSGVRRHLAELIEAGLVEARPSERPDGGRSTNRYLLMVRSAHIVGKRGMVKVNTPPVQSEQAPSVTAEQGPLFTAEQCIEPLKEEPLKEGNNPPLPSGETPPQPDLLGGLPAIVEPKKPDLVEIVFNRWREMAARIPGIASIDVLSDSRRKKIAARGNDAKTKDRTPEDAWRQVFEAIEASSYLCGEDPPGRNYTEPFRLTIEFVTRPSEFLKILDGGYRANRSAETHDTVTGRRFGPAEQGGRAAIARIRAADAQRGLGDDDASGGEADGRGDGQPRRLRSAFDNLGVDLRGAG